MPRKNNSQKKRGKRGQTDRVLDAGENLAGISLNPPLSFPRQAFCTLWLPGEVAFLNCTSGIANGNTQISPFLNVRDWASRFGVTFNEYRTIRIEVKVRPNLAPSYLAGNHFSMIEEDGASTVATSSTMMQQRDCVLRPNDPANPKAVYQLNWRVQDVHDLDFTPVTIAAIPIRFRMHVSPTSTGTDPSYTGSILEIRPWFLVQFRDLGSTAT